MRWVLVAVYVATTVAAIPPAVTAWRRRRQSPYAVPLAVTLFGISEWSLGQALAAVAPTLQLATIATYGIYPGVCASVIGFFHKSVMMGRGLSSLSRRTIGLLVIEPGYVAVSVITDPWTHWFYRDLHLNARGVLVIQPGVLYWLHAAYSYALLVTGTVLIMRALLRAVAGHRRAFVLFLVGSVVPVAANAATLFQDVNAQSTDLTPASFLVTVAVWGLAERGASLTGFAPVAYQHVLAALTDAVMVLDNADRVLDVNPAAARLLRPGPQRLLGRPWREAVIPELVDEIGNGRLSTVTVGPEQVLEVRSVPVLSDYGQLMGSVVVCRDVTELERLRADLVEQANRDPLTGIPNRRYLTGVLRAAVERATELGEPLTVVMIDLDHFKRVNDRYGHAAGDELLKNIAERLASTLRPGDTVARYGGEEFVVVMPGASVEQAAGRAETWREECAATALDIDGRRLSVTISAGVAGLPDGGDAGLPDGGDAERTLRLADEALYAAKAGGRDRVVVAGPTHRRRSMATTAGPADLAELG